MTCLLWSSPFTTSGSAYSLPFPLQNTLVHGRPAPSLAVSQCFPAQLIPWQFSVSEQITVRPEGLHVEPLPGQKLVSVRGTHHKDLGKPTQWGEVVSLVAHPLTAPHNLCPGMTPETSGPRPLTLSLPAAEPPLPHIHTHNRILI